MSFELLPAAIDKLQKQIPVAVAKATNEIAFEILRVVASNTPVDTSKAISNWRVSLHSTFAGDVEAHYEGVHGSTKELSVQRTIDLGKQRLSNRIVGTEIHIFNNADYIDGLNDGTISRQPGLFVQKALLAGKIKIQKTQIRLE